MHWKFSNPSIPGDSSDKGKKPVEPITVKEHEDTRTDGQLPMTSGSPLMKPIDIGKNDDSDFICVNDTPRKLGRNKVQQCTYFEYK